MLKWISAIVLAISLASAAVAGSSKDASSNDAAHAAFERGDYATALRLWVPLAKKGYAAAQFNLGLLYDQGHGVARDAAKAAKWYRLAAAQGYAKAQYSLGLLSEHNAQSIGHFF